jgi:uncharacterized protein YprB with RNaseH-like and TPR domain
MGNPKYTLKGDEKAIIEAIRGESLPESTENRWRLAPHEEEAILNFRDGIVAPHKMRKRLYFDIETSPNITLTWRTGYKLNIPHDNIIEERAIICIVYKWEGEDETHAFTWDENQCDKTMLEEFIKIANEADELLGHNGDRFDLKWVKTRCLFHRIPTFPKYQTIDTLKIVKKEFYLNSNRLDYIAKFLGFGGKMETGGFDLWKRIVLDKCQESLDKMVEYCRRDVVLLENVHQEIKRYTEHKTHHGVKTGGEKYSCPECGSVDSRLNKTSTTKMGTTKRQMFCKSCNTYHTISNKAYMDFLDDKSKGKI